MNNEAAELGRAVATDQTITAPVLKITSAWVLVGITSWADFAAALAALYTLILLAEWCWKKIKRLRRRDRRRDDGR